MKRQDVGLFRAILGTFSILERIDVGETFDVVFVDCLAQAFSILERIDVGETAVIRCALLSSQATFSILERIDVGETHAMARA